jgi:hypothetical protein
VFGIGWWSSFFCEITGPNRARNGEIPEKILDDRRTDLMHYVKLLPKFQAHEAIEEDLSLGNIVAMLERWFKKQLSDDYAFYALLLLDWYLRRFWGDEKAVLELKEFLRNLNPSTLMADMLTEFSNKARAIVTSLEKQFPLDVPAGRIVTSDELFEALRELQT